MTGWRPEGSAGRPGHHVAVRRNTERGRSEPCIYGSDGKGEHDRRVTSAPDSQSLSAVRQVDPELSVIVWLFQRG